MKTAVIILGHGSRGEGAGDVLPRIVAEVKRLGGFEIVEHAFLQYVQPALDEALRRCVEAKAERIVIVPFFMQAGAHVTQDIPTLADSGRKRYPGIDIIVTNFAGAHPLMANIVVDLVRQMV